MKQKQDRHHIFWPRNNYQSGEWQKLRQCDLFIPVVDWEAHHRGLHPNVRPPFKPAEAVALGALAIAESMPGATPVEAIKELQQYLIRVGDNNIAQNIGQQLTYITIGGRDGRKT